MSLHFKGYAALTTIVQNGDADDNFGVWDEFLGGNWEKLAELGRDWTTSSELLYLIYDLATFRFFYFDL